MIKIISHIDIISTDVENAISAAFCDRIIYLSSSYDLINLRLKSPILSKKLRYTENLFTPSDFESDKDLIKNIITECDIIFLDNFLFLNNKETYIVNTALSLHKTVYIINKIFPDGTGKHIIDSILSSIKEEYAKSIEYIKFPLIDKVDITNLDLIKRKFPLKSKYDSNEIFDDASVKIEKSFPSLDSEFRFIVKSIREKLENIYEGDIEKIVKALNNDFSIVLPSEFNKYKKQFINIFKEEGIFLLNEELFGTDLLANINISFLNKIYFKKRDFLRTAILNKNGKPINFSEKLKLFNQCYYSIDFADNKKNLTSLPASQYLLLISDILSNGISLSSFKDFLFLNQKYYPSCEEWNEYISEFKLVKLYFKNSNDINEWFSIAVRLINLRLEMTEDKVFEYHPLYHIKFESLSFFQKTLWDLSNVIYKLKPIKDNFDTIAALLLNDTSIASGFHDSSEGYNTLRNALLKTISDFKAVTNQIEDNSFLEIINYVTKDLNEEIDISLDNPLVINIVSQSNIRPFKYTYVTMSAREKYHESFIDDFSLTEEYADLSYISPAFQSTARENILNEEYLLKNTLDFTSNEITFTYSAKNFVGNDLESIYLNDICNIISKTTDESDKIDKSQNLYMFSADKNKPFKFSRKDVYSVRELGQFLLCPKLYYLKEIDEEKSPYITEFTLRYYAEALIFCDTLNRFMEYNLDYKKTYPKLNSKCKDILLNFFKESFEFNQRFFIFILESDLKTIYANIENRLLIFIDNAIKSVKGKKFSIISYKDKIYNYQGLNIKVESDCRVYEPELKKWRRRCNNEYLEFLVRSAHYSNSTNTAYKYELMKNILEGNDINQDRLALALGIISKISIQYDNEKYSLDGFFRAKKLTDEILNYDFAKTEVKQSGYCRYCGKFDVCLGK